MSDRDERTGAELLREAARLMRDDYGPDADVDGCPEGDPFMLAVIDWLEYVADQGERSAINHRARALAVGRAYLTAPVSAGEPAVAVMTAEESARVKASLNAPTDPDLCVCGHEGLGTGWHSNTCPAHDESARIVSAGEPKEDAHG